MVLWLLLQECVLYRGVGASIGDRKLWVFENLQTSFSVRPRAGDTVCFVTKDKPLSSRSIPHIGVRSSLSSPLAQLETGYAVSMVSAVGSDEVWSSHPSGLS